MPLEMDRTTGGSSYTLDDLAAQAPGTSHETFHFVLNNTVIKDNRIPPYGMTYETARERNALPVPADQYGAPSGNQAYEYWDTASLTPPANAVYADISLMYQPTSWEYIQFLYLANDKSNAFLAAEGDNLLDAWLNTGMAEPAVMASAVWGSQPEPPGPVCEAPGTPQAVNAEGGKRSITLTWSAGSPPPDGGYNIYYDQAGKYQFVAGVPAGTLSFRENRLPSRVTYTYVLSAWQDCDGNGAFDPAMDIESLFSAPVSATTR
jgi:hypothetical protein